MSWRVSGLTVLDKDHLTVLIGHTKDKMDELRRRIALSKKCLNKDGLPYTRQAAMVYRYKANRDLAIMALVRDCLSQALVFGSLELSPFGLKGLDKLVFSSSKNNKENYYKGKV